MNRAKSPQTKNIINTQRISPVIRKNAQLINNILNQILFKKIRFTFQVIKQYYLFPSGSSSSVTSLENYDKLFFNDEKIHTLVKKLQTKVLQRKIWAFLNIKMLKILKQVNTMTVKISKVVHKKQVQLKNYGFTKIKIKSKQISPIKKRMQDSGSQTKIQSYSRIQQQKPRVQQVQRSRIQQIQRSTTVINQTQEFVYRAQPRVYIHRGSRSRSRSVSPNNSYTRVLREQQIRVYPKEYIGNVHIHQMTPKTVITSVIQRTPARNYSEVDQVKRQYRNCYRIAPTRIRVVSCGCEHLLQKSCHCTSLLDRLCGCSTCCHSCEGCNSCNSCHSHCNCRDCSRSFSKDKKTIKVIKSPSKKHIQDKPVQTRNSYMNHLQNYSPRNQNIKYEYTENRVTQIRR